MAEDDADDSAVADSSLVDTVEKTEQVHPSKTFRRRVAVSAILVVAIILAVVAANWPSQASRRDVVVRSASAVPTTDTTSIGSTTADVTTTDSPTSTEAPAASYAPIGLAPDVTAAPEPADTTPGTLIAEPEPATESTTTMLVCHNSTNPACGPFYYDPALTNEPGTMRVEASPSDADVGFVAGQDIFFSIITKDPDSAIWGIDGSEFRDVSQHGGGFCGWYDFGEGEGAHGHRGPGACVYPGCPEPVNRYGPWEPPPKHPTNDHVALVTDHNFAAPGTYHVSLTITLDPCGPRLEELTGTTTVHILG